MGAPHCDWTSGNCQFVSVYFQLKFGVRLSGPSQLQYSEEAKRVIVQRAPEKMSGQKRFASFDLLDVPRCGVCKQSDSRAWVLLNASIAKTLKSDGKNDIIFAVIEGIPCFGNKTEKLSSHFKCLN
jgi:hypothetical protein